MGLKEKVNVLIVHNYYQIPGGEDTVVDNEKKLLEDNGHKVYLYSRNNAELNTFSSMKKLILPVDTIFSFRTYREIKKMIKELHIDIVHVHNTLSLISPSVYYAALHCNLPVIQTIHNFRFLCPGATFYRDGHICEECVNRGLLHAVNHNCYRDSKFQTLACVISTSVHRLLGIYRKLNYICLTDFNREKLLQLKQINEANVFIKPNFVETKNEITYCEEQRNQFVYAGRLDKLKGIDVLFEAWRQMKDTAPELLVCGTGPMEEWCKLFIMKHNITRIKILGFVSNSEVKNIMASSKAIILPTQWYEGFPMTIVESYSVGTPVIGSDIGNVGSLIEDGVSGIKFKHDSPEQLVAAIRKFESNPFKINEELRMRYSAENNYHVLSKIYENLR